MAFHTPTPTNIALPTVGREGKPSLMRPAIALMAFLLPAASALAADCTTPAAPGVDWQRCYMDGRNLSRHDLSGSRLRETSFQRANLAGADLSGVDGYRARFITTAMAGARLDRGIFAEADFTKADLAGASLKEADLRRTKFFRAILREADLTGAKMLGADLSNADLTGARWTDGQRICGEGSIGQCN